jgi:tetratricopeptide (TPR) repeat protein
LALACGVALVVAGARSTADAKSEGGPRVDHQARAYDLENAGKYEEALAEYREDIGLYPGHDSDVYWRAGEMELRLKRPRRAIPLLEHATHDGIEAGGCEHIALAEAYEAVEKLKRARRVLERELADAPNFIRVRLALAGFLARHGDCAAARTRLAEAERSHPDASPDVRGWAVHAREEVGARCPAEPSPAVQGR